MYFYYFLLKRYRNNYQQAKCFVTYLSLFVPVIAFASMIRHSSTVMFHTVLFLTGWCSWTFIEYILHRFWMHNKSSNSAIAQTHHHHHTHPSQIVVTNLPRLAMFTLAAITVVIARYLNNYFTELAGLFFGFVGYFMMHQFLHLKLSQKVFKKLVRYHIYHHCKYPNTCFGVSVPWWDDIFMTVPTAPKLTQRIIDFYFDGNEKESQSSLRNTATGSPLQLNATKNCNSDCSTCRASLQKCNSIQMTGGNEFC
jgi:hypothetical protein